MENKKASWGDAFRLNWRAARIWFSQYPNMFYSAAADYGLIKSLSKTNRSASHS